MIAPSSAWVRVGLRRIPNAPSRNTNTGNTNNLERARLRLRLSNASRRYNSTSQEGAQGAAGAARTIPGPSWLWLDPIVEPFRAYGRVQQRRPYMTQLVSSLIIYFIGDCVAQSIAQPEPSVQRSEAAEDDADEKGWVQKWSEERDWTRTARALIIGGLSAIPSYRWFLWLSNSFNYRSKTLSLSIKVFINQAFFTPLFNSYFFGMQTLLSGASFPEIIERIRNTVPTSWWNSCKVWPAVTAFSFTYVPIQYRSIFSGVVAIGWQTYLNLLNQQAAAEEEMQHAAGHVAPVNMMTVHAHSEGGQGMQKCAA